MTDIVIVIPPCNRCGSTNVGTGGKCPTSGKQRYKCRDCGRLFVEHNRIMPTIEEIQRAMERDKSIQQIAEFYDISDSAIYAKLRSHGIPSPQRVRPKTRWTIDRVEELRSMVSQGIPLNTIADHYGLTRLGLQNVLREHGIKAKRGS